MLTQYDFDNLMKKLKDLDKRLEKIEDWVLKEKEGCENWYVPPDSWEEL